MEKWECVQNVELNIRKIVWSSLRRWLESAMVEGYRKIFLESVATIL
ncbi:MAG: hypothetical protein QW762_02545 [Candidatus Thermoplasmatota archaeon]